MWGGRDEDEGSSKCHWEDRLEKWPRETTSQSGHENLMFTSLCWMCTGWSSKMKVNPSQSFQNIFSKLNVCLLRSWSIWGNNGSAQDKVSQLEHLWQAKLDSGNLCPSGGANCGHVRPRCLHSRYWGQAQHCHGGGQDEGRVGGSERGRNWEFTLSPGNIRHWTFQ